jgi:hypothetical protein
MYKDAKQHTLTSHVCIYKYENIKSEEYEKVKVPNS